VRYEVVAAVRVLGTSFLYTTGVDQRRCLARRDLALHFHPSHFLELHQIAPRALCSAQRCRGKYQSGHATGDQTHRPFARSHISPKKQLPFRILMEVENFRKFIIIKIILT
jgi:hypothetical protein